MSNDLEEKLRKRLGLNAPAETPLLGTGTTELATEDSFKKITDRLEQENNSPLVAYLVFDTTGSMTFIIDAVRRCIEQIGRELLGANIEAAIIGAGDHCDEPALQRKGVRMLGNYGQDNDPTALASVLQQQIEKIVSTSGGDEPEAYECLAADLAARIQQDKVRYPQKKHIVAFFGDSRPHEQKEEACPNHRGPEQLLVLAAMADHTYFINCQEQDSLLEYKPYRAHHEVGIFEKYTYGVVKDSEKTTLIQFNQAKDILPEAIIGMVKKIQSPQEYKKYLTQLSEPKKLKIAGLLGPHE